MYAAEDIPFNELPRGNGESGAVREIADALREAGIDTTTRLYDESLQLAREGHLGRSRDRLRMLLCLDPDDGHAHLLLAKIFACQKRWQEAIAELDAAAACGVRLPPAMKTSFETARDSILQDNRGDQVSARITAEVRALREEARRLRVDRTRLERTNGEMTRKNQIWMLSTAGTGLLALVFLALSFRGGAETIPTEADLFAVDPIYAEYGVQSTPHGVPTLEPTVLEPTPQLNLVPGLVPAAAAMVPNAAPAAEAPQKAVEYTPTVELPATYTVAKGDNIGKIAQKMYGKYSLWPAIRDANTQTLGSGIDLSIGMELTIPKL
jgi:nucleoid-associated protein YgaU